MRKTRKENDDSTSTYLFPHQILCLLLIFLLSQCAAILWLIWTLRSISRVYKLQTRDNSLQTVMLFNGGICVEIRWFVILWRISQSSRNIVKSLEFRFRTALFTSCLSKNRNWKWCAIMNTLVNKLALSWYENFVSVNLIINKCYNDKNGIAAFWIKECFDLLFDGDTLKVLK